MDDKRYQVFVSSTYRDLIEERQEVMHALLELDCIPSGMELFPAANESQWELIKRVIAECDYYVIIIGGRYGSIGPDGISYTEMEYRYAASISKPIIAFLHEDPGSITVSKSEDSPEGRNKLQAFRALVEQRICKYWRSTSDLGAVVSRGITHLRKTTPAIGWVRADVLPDRDTTREILRLRDEVERLRGELETARAAASINSEDLAQGEDPHEITFTFIASKSGRDGKFSFSKFTADFIAKWNDIFASIAPLMIDEASEKTLKEGLLDFIVFRNKPYLIDDFEGAKIHTFGVEDADLHTIIIQLRALGLIHKSTKVRSVRDKSTYWSLTPFGDDLMTRLRAIKHVSGSDRADTNSGPNYFEDD